MATNLIDGMLLSDSFRGSIRVLGEVMKSDRSGGCMLPEERLDSRSPPALFNPPSPVRSGKLVCVL
jgi:hypothetical protein